MIIFIVVAILGLVGALLKYSTKIKDTKDISDTVVALAGFAIIFLFYIAMMYLI